MSNADQESTITIVDDESVAVRFLSEAPDFFDRHPDILAKLTVTHPESGDAVSLIERQVDVLRNRVAELETKFQQMVATARVNEDLQERMHALMVALAEVSINAANSDAAMARIQQEVKKAFDIEYVTLKSVTANNANGEKESDGDGAEVQSAPVGYAQAKARLAQGRCLCDDKLPQDILDYFFGDDAKNVGSCALLPLARGDQTFAIVAIGAEDRERFSPDWGTLYLDRLAAMLSVVVSG
jgi:uncharacterized protein YigA (DUF484 family)